MQSIGAHQIKLVVDIANCFPTIKVCDICPPCVSTILISHFVIPFVFAKTLINLPIGGEHHVESSVSAVIVLGPGIAESGAHVGTEDSVVDHIGQEVHVSFDFLAGTSGKVIQVTPFVPEHLGIHIECGYISTEHRKSGPESV